MTLPHHPRAGILTAAALCYAQPVRYGTGADVRLPTWLDPVTTIPTAPTKVLDCVTGLYAVLLTRAMLRRDDDLVEYLATREGAILLRGYDPDERPTDNVDALRGAHGGQTAWRVVQVWRSDGSGHACLWAEGGVVVEATTSRRAWVRPVASLAELVRELDADGPGDVLTVGRL